MLPSFKVNSFFLLFLFFRDIKHCARVFLYQAENTQILRTCRIFRIHEFLDIFYSCVNCCVLSIVNIARELNTEILCWLICRLPIHFSESEYKKFTLHLNCVLLSLVLLSVLTVSARATAANAAPTVSIWIEVFLWWVNLEFDFLLLFFPNLILLFSSVGEMWIVNALNICAKNTVARMYRNSEKRGEVGKRSKWWIVSYICAKYRHYSSDSKTGSSSLVNS